jgi:hypothetical protein
LFLLPKIPKDDSNHMTGGPEWTRTTDLTLIRGAL